MQRAELTAPGEPLIVAQAEMPRVPSKGLLIKMMYSGICQSDLKLAIGSVPMGDGKVLNYLSRIGAEGFKGIVPGHELCGKVIEVGADVGSQCPHAVGDVVVVYPWTGCRNCEYCYDELSHMCADNKVSTTDIGRGYDGKRHGGFQSYFPLEEWHFAVKLPESIPPHIGCMMPCSTITSYVGVQKCREAIERGIKHTGKGKLLIIGIGGLGSWALIIAKTIFGDKIEVSCADVTEEKMAAAKEMKADEAILISRQATMDDMVAQFTAKGKVDACIDIVGLPQTIEACFWSVKNAGVVVPLGIGGGQLSVATPALTGRCISIVGSRTGSLAELKAVVALFQEKGFYAQPPMEYVTLSDVNDVFARMKTGTVNGRAIVKFD